MVKLISKILHHPMLHKQTVVQATILITIVNFLGKFVGFAREMLIAKYFGATGVMDAYVIGLQVPTLVLGLFAGGLGTLIIPMYISRKQKDPQDAKRYVNQILVVWGAIFLVVSALTAVFAPQLVRLVAYGFEGERFDLAVQITRLLALYGFMNIVNFYFTSLLQAEKQFFVTALSTVTFNALGVSIIFVFSKPFGVFSMVVGSYVFVFCNFALNVALLIKKYHLLSLMKIAINWIEIKEFFLLLFPLILSAGVGTINAIVDRTIASTLPQGSIAALQYSQKIWTLPASLFVGSLAVAIFPSFSELATHAKRSMEYKQSINKTIITLLYFLIPATIFLMMFSIPITRLFYQRGAFDSSDTELTSFVNQMYCIGIFFMAVYPILMKVFYSFKKTIIPLIISVVVVGLNIVGNIVLSKYLFAGGIALSTSLTQGVGFVFSYALLRRYFKAKEIEFRSTNQDLLLEAGKICVACVPVILIGFIVLPWAQSVLPFILQAIKLGLIALIMAIVFLFSSKLIKSMGYDMAQGYILSGAKALIIVRQKKER